MPEPEGLIHAQIARRNAQALEFRRYASRVLRQHVALHSAAGARRRDPYRLDRDRNSDMSALKVGGDMQELIVRHVGDKAWPEDHSLGMRCGRLPRRIRLE